MGEEQALRAVLLTFFLLLLPIGVYRRVRSQATREKLDRRQEGVFVLATLRPLGAVFWIGLIAWLISPRSMAWSEISLPLSLRWAGVGVLIAAAPLVIWTLRCLGTNLTDTVVTRQQHTLVTHGPYRWVRHPFYIGAAMLTTAIALITANWFLLVIGTMVIAVLAVRTRIEEDNLIARFGNDYQQYMRRTGRFLPRIRP